MTGAELAAAAAQKLLVETTKLAIRQMREAHERRVAEALPELCASVAALSGSGHADALAEINRHVAEAKPETLALLEAHFRRRLGDLAPAAVPFVTKLTASYFARNLIRDRFFVRAGRLLERAEDEDVNGLTALFELVSQHPDYGSSDVGVAQVDVYEQRASIVLHTAGAIRYPHAFPAAAQLIAPASLLLAHRLVDDGTTAANTVALRWTTPEGLHTLRSLVGLFTTTAFPA